MIIPVGYLQANYFFEGPDLPFGAEITLGMKYPDATLPSAAASFMGGAIFGSGIDALLDNDLQISKVRVKYGPNDTGPVAEASIGLTGTGGTGGSLPSASWLVRKSTLFGGHAGRGRFYVPGLQASSYNNDGTVKLASLGTMQTVMDDFYNALTDTDWSPVLLHGAESPLTTPSVIQAFTVDGRMATQRRRLRR